MERDKGYASIQLLGLFKRVRRVNDVAYFDLSDRLSEFDCNFRQHLEHDIQDLARITQSTEAVKNPKLTSKSAKVLLNLIETWGAIGQDSYSSTFCKFTSLSANAISKLLKDRLDQFRHAFIESRSETILALEAEAQSSLHGVPVEASLQSVYKIHKCVLAVESFLR